MYVEINVRFFEGLFLLKSTLLSTQCGYVEVLFWSFEILLNRVYRYLVCCRYCMSQLVRNPVHVWLYVFVTVDPIRINHFRSRELC